MSEPTISPPTEMDLSLPLGMLAVQMYHTPNQYSELEYRLLRRCHAAESERDRLAERLRRAEVVTGGPDTAGIVNKVEALVAENVKLRSLLHRVKRVLPPGELYKAILSVLHEGETP